MGEAKAQLAASTTATANGSTGAFMAWAMPTAMGVHRTAIALLLTTFVNKATIRKNADSTTGVDAPATTDSMRVTRYPAPPVPSSAETIARAATIIMTILRSIARDAWRRLMPPLPSTNQTV